MGDDCGSWSEILPDTREALDGRSILDSAKRRLRLAEDMGCIALDSKVTACCFPADRGNSSEYVEPWPRAGREQRGVLQEPRDTFEEASEGFSESIMISSVFGRVRCKPCSRPCLYLSFARPKRSCKLTETCRIKGLPVSQICSIVRAHVHFMLFKTGFDTVYYENMQRRPVQICRSFSPFRPVRRTRCLAYLNNIDSSSGLLVQARLAWIQGGHVTQVNTDKRRTDGGTCGSDKGKLGGSGWTR